MDIISNLLRRIVATSAGTKTTTNRFSFEDCLQFLEETGKKVHGEGFRIYPEDHKLIFTLLVYFLEDGENAQRLGINLRKGILLTGPVGCGKTSLMRLMRYMLPREKTFHLKTCREVGLEFNVEGYRVLQQYGRNSLYWREDGYVPKTYCFDDLGSEGTGRYYGNECNVMEEILLTRYEYFISNHMVTHLTTNFSSSELEKLYGSRVRSRLREMCNLVSFGREAKDRRS
jgi:energy-coupling factor transporter ATP-binding protein EcfA2